MKDYYKILNVNEKATQLEIKNSYRQLAKRYHPDVVSPDDKAASQMFSDINEANEVLSDPDKRAEYDKQRLAEKNGTARPQGGAAYGAGASSRASSFGSTQSQSAASMQADEAIKRQANTVATYCASIAVKSFVGIDANTVMRLVKTVQQNMFNNIYKLGVDGKNLGYNYGYKLGREAGVREGQNGNQQGNEQLKRDVQRLEAEVARFNRLVSSYENEISALNEKVETLTRENDDLRATVASNELIIHDLNDTLTENKGDLLTKDDIIEQIKLDKKTTVDDCLKQYDILRSEYESYKRTVAENEKTHIQAESDLRARANMSEGRNLTLLSQIDELRRQVDDYDKKVRDMQRMLNNAYAGSGGSNN